MTVKPVYGHEEERVVGYNLHKPGRPLHAVHAYMMVQTRLILDVAVHPGNESWSAAMSPEQQCVASMW